MSLTLAQYADLVASTLEEYGPPTFQQIAQDLHRYEVMSKWLKKDKVVFDSGRGISRRLMLSYQNVARHVGIYEADNTYLNDVMQTLTAPWVHANTFWLFDRIEDAVNSGKAMLNSVIKPKEAQAMLALASTLETKAWSCPGASETTLPYGIPYWVVKNASTGFNGGAPSGHSTVGGITPTANWKNYTAQYTSIAKDDLIAKMRTAYRNLQWESPLDQDDKGYRKQMQAEMRLYTTGAVIDAMVLLAEDQNDQLGRDLASLDGRTLFRGHPLVWVEQLDSDSTDPVYMIDHSSFFPICLKRNYLVRTGPQKKANHHNVLEVFIDLSYNYVCVDRRRQAVIATA